MGVRVSVSADVPCTHPNPVYEYLELNKAELQSLRKDCSEKMKPVIDAAISAAC